MNLKFPILEFKGLVHELVFRHFQHFTSRFVETLMILLWLPSAVAKTWGGRCTFIAHQLLGASPLGTIHIKMTVADGLMGQVANFSTQLGAWLLLEGLFCWSLVRFELKMGLSSQVGCLLWVVLVEILGWAWP